MPSSVEQARNEIHRTFAILFAIAIVVQLPFSWIMWVTLSGHTNTSLDAALAIGDYVFPIVVVVLLWFGFGLYRRISLAISSWYGAVIIVVKAITILGTILAVFPLSSLRTSNIVQIFYSAVILLALLYSKRKTLELSKNEIVWSVIGTILVACLFVIEDIMLIFQFSYLI